MNLIVAVDNHWAIGHKAENSGDIPAGDATEKQDKYHFVF